MTSCYICQPKKAVLINEPKEALFSLKTKKSAGYDEINFIAKGCFGTWNMLVLHVFNLSIFHVHFSRQTKNSRGYTNFQKEVLNGIKAITGPYLFYHAPQKC